jgi:hypothetical protein
MGFMHCEQRGYKIKKNSSMLERQFKTKINKTVLSWTGQRSMRIGEIPNE